jgi:CPA2 family monovalent cation:H+ antiporter-2
VLAIAALLALVTAITKVATGWWAAQRAGVGRLGRVRAGTVIVARGEFNIVIAGLAAGVEPALGPLAAAYVLVMAVAGPIITRVAEPVAARLFGRLPRRRAAEGAPAVTIDERGDLPER